MELLETIIDTVVTADLDWEPLLLMPIGDVQLGSGATDEDKFKRHMEWGMEHGAYFLGMGDYVDVASPSNRHALRTAALYDSVADLLEEGAGRAVDHFLQLSRGTEGRWLGLLEGHHFYEFADGSTSDTRIARALRSPFLGSAAFVRIRFRRSDHATVTATIFCHHGAGSGNRVGSPLAKLEGVMPYFDADIYLMGHQHKVVGAPIDQLYMTRKRPYRLDHRTKLLACTGSFMQGYKASHRSAGRAQGTYVEKAFMNPVALGGVVITVEPEHDSKRGDRLDMRISL